MVKRIDQNKNSSQSRGEMNPVPAEAAKNIRNAAGYKCVLVCEIGLGVRCFYLSVVWYIYKIRFKYPYLGCCGI